MKHLVIYAHPNENSLNHYLLHHVKTGLQNHGHELVVRDLYQIGFDPVLSLNDMQGQRMGKVCEEVKIEQDFITWADHITFVYPIWWTGMPAILKGYIDRVMSYGFAYRYDNGVQKGLLSAKKTTIINTQGKSQEEYKSIGMDKALRLTSDQGVYEYCGMEISQHFFFDQADKADQENINTWINQIKSQFEF
tara:strand:- start:1249 stop:1824 length:576 start_codon:yes stop_codon:yes gene_type:complete